MNENESRTWIAAERREERERYRIEELTRQGPRRCVGPVRSKSFAGATAYIHEGDVRIAM